MRVWVGFWVGLQPSLQNPIGNAAGCHHLLMIGSPGTGEPQDMETLDDDNPATV